MSHAQSPERKAVWVDRKSANKARTVARRTERKLKPVRLAISR